MTLALYLAMHMPWRNDAVSKKKLRQKLSPLVSSMISEEVCNGDGT